MKFLVYGRENPQSTEIPLNTQKNGCQIFCEQNSHSFEEWFEDETPADSDLLERDGFKSLIQHLIHNEVDGILCYSRDRISNDPGIIASLDPLFDICMGEDIEIWEPSNKIEVKDSEDPQSAAIGKAMANFTMIANDWRDISTKVRQRESLNNLAQKDGPKSLGRPPFGVETDKSRFDNRTKVNEYYPDDQGEKDLFKVAIQVLNEFGHADTTPREDHRDPTAYSVYKKYDEIGRTSVWSVWKNRETYRDVAKNHRPELTIMF